MEWFALQTANRARVGVFVADACDARLNGGDVC